MIIYSGQTKFLPAIFFNETIINIILAYNNTLDPYTIYAIQ